MKFQSNTKIYQRICEQTCMQNARAIYAVNQA